MSSFQSTLVVDCPFSIALEYVSNYLRQFASGDGKGAIVGIPLRTFGLPIPGSLRHRVRIQFKESVDTDARNRSGRGLTFDWDAGDPLLPDLHGELSFRIAGESRTELVLTGVYRPPLGSAGAVLDRFLGNRIALATGRALLERFGADMERQEDNFRASHRAASITS